MISKSRINLNKLQYKQKGTGTMFDVTNKYNLQTQYLEEIEIN